MEDLNLLGEIQVIPEQDGLLLFPDFCRINKLIKKYTHPIFVPSLKKLIDQRRDFYNRSDMKNYRQRALDFAKVDESFSQMISEEILGHFQIEQQTFFDSWIRGLAEDQNNQNVISQQQNQIYLMIVKKR